MVRPFKFTFHVEYVNVLSSESRVSEGGCELASLLVEYDGKKVITRHFPERLRDLAWDRKGSRLTLVGNRGLMLAIQDEEQVSLKSGTRHNLRAVSTNPAHGIVLAVGNSGTIIASKPDGSFSKMGRPTFENLRAVKWNGDGTLALLAGNKGSLIKYSDRGLDLIDDGRANLRGISWRSQSDEVLISSNCFAEEFIPSPNLFSFHVGRNVLRSVSEGRFDLIGVDWNPGGRFAIVVGYDVVWHNGFIARFDGETLSPIKFQNEHVYPVAVGWDPAGRMAAIGTSTAHHESGHGRLMLWDGKDFSEIYRSDEFFFSHVAWAPAGFKLAAIASTDSRTFDC
jgi:hypothetical protein